MDAKKLREEMRKKGITVSRLCLEIGISRKSFWSKCKGLTEFKQSEMAKIIDVLELDNAAEIFFPAKVS